MRYLDNLNKLYERQLIWHGSKSLSTGQIALWHALMHIANRQRWPEWFSASAEQLKILSGLSPSGVCTTANELKKMGLIDFRGARGKREYRMADLAATVDNSVDNPVDNVQNPLWDCS